MPVMVTYYTINTIGFCATGSGGVAAQAALAFHADRGNMGYHFGWTDAVYCACDAQSLNGDPREFHEVSAVVAHEREQLIHAGRCRMGPATMRTDHLGVGRQRLEESLMVCRGQSKLARMAENFWSSYEFRAWPKEAFSEGSPTTIPAGSLLSNVRVDENSSTVAFDFDGHRWKSLTEDFGTQQGFVSEL